MAYFFGPPCIFKVCRIVGVDAQKLTFHRCRAPDPVGQVFTIDQCSAGQVMDIESAVVGYSEGAQLYASLPQCNERTCTLSFYSVVFQLCNGRRSCSIDQNLLRRPGPGYTALCSVQTDANFIDVEFYCVSGTV